MPTKPEVTPGVLEAAERLRIAMREIERPFLAAADELRDLRPRFWVWLGIVSGTAASDRPALLVDAVDTAHAILGAPGDFGYGTPCGEALRSLYERKSQLCRALHHARNEDLPAIHAATQPEAAS